MWRPRRAPRACRCGSTRWRQCCRIGEAQLLGRQTAQHIVDPSPARSQCEVDCAFPEILPRRIHILHRIVPAVRIRIQRLWIGKAGAERIATDEPAQPLIVVPGIRIVDPDREVFLVAREPVLDPLAIEPAGVLLQPCAAATPHRCAAATTDCPFIRRRAPPLNSLRCRSCKESDCARNFLGAENRLLPKTCPRQ